MRGSKEKIWPMTQDQSFIAAGAFITILVSALFMTVSGDKLLSWINQNAGLASWVQAIGALAILAATYQLHFDLKKERDLEKLENNKNKAAEARIFIALNKEIFTKLECFLFAVKSGQRYETIKEVEYPAVEFFRGVIKHIDEINATSEKISELFALGKVPSFCTTEVYNVMMRVNFIVNVYNTVTDDERLQSIISNMPSVLAIATHASADEQADYMQKYMVSLMHVIKDYASDIEQNFLKIKNNVFVDD